MIRPLLRLELRARRPALAAAAALAVGGPVVVGALLSEVGQRPRAVADYALAASGPLADLLALATLLLAFVTVHDAFARPRQRGSDTFLAGLPLTPTAIYTARALSCLAVVLLVPLLRHPVAVLAHSVHGEWPPGLIVEVAVPAFLGDTLRTLMALALALSFGQARRAGWLAAGSLLLTLRLLSTRTPLPTELDLLAFAGPSAEAVAPGATSALVALLLGVGSVALGWRVFVQPPPLLDRIEHAVTRGVFLPRLCSALALLLGVAVPLALAAPAIELGPPTAHYPSAVVTAHTEHYRFTYPARLEPHAQELIAEADGIHERVHTLLGLTPSGAPLTLDLTDLASPLTGSEHARLHLGEAPLYALARLTCAARLEQEAGPRLSEAARMLATFEEGLCRNVAWRASNTDPFWSRFQATIHHSRIPFRASEVFDRGELLRTRGPEVGPSLGEAFVEGIVRERGVDALPKLVQAVATQKRRVYGSDSAFEAWKEVLEQVDLSPGQIEERLLAVVEDDVLDDPRARMALPRLRVFLDIQEKPIGWRVVAIPDKDLPEGWLVVCRLRRGSPDDVSFDRPRGVGAWSEESPTEADEGTLLPQRMGPDAKGCDAFFLRASPFQGQPWVQVGLAPLDRPALGGTLWEAWQSPNGSP